MSAAQAAALCRSNCVMRAHTIVRARSPACVMARSVSISCVPMAAMPTSSSGTPASSSARAMASFSSREKATPAVCSPSRSVVSFSVQGQGDEAGCMVGVAEVLPLASQRLCHACYQSKLLI